VATNPELIERDEFRRLADIALNASKGEHTLVSLADTAGGTTRFANNQVTQNVHARRYQMTITVAFGKRAGSATLSELSEGPIIEAALRAERLAKMAPEDPEYLPPLPAQEYPVLPAYRPETAECTPARRVGLAGEAIKLCRAAGMTAAGIVEAYTTAVGLAASTGLFAYELRTRAEFSLTAIAADSTGWVQNESRSIDDLGVIERARTAIDKARRSANPQELAPGRYTVVLEPACVAGLVGPLQFAANAKGYFRGTSALAGKLGQQVADSRLTLQNRPDHPSLLGASFDGQGLPADSRKWIDRGVLVQLDYDRFTAQEKGVPPSFGLDAAHLSGENPVGSVDALIESTDRGVLVTNFWYIRPVNPTDLTLTGMTRDGTFLIEDGQIAGGLINFRWHDSPLRVLNALEAFTEPLDAITLERPKMFLPALKVRDFNFSSVTKF